MLQPPQWQEKWLPALKTIRKALTGWLLAELKLALVAFGIMLVGFWLLGTGNPLGVVIATIAGVPMYADIFGTNPIAEALLAKGAQLGVVLSFMMGVTTLSVPSMIMLRKAIKPKLLGVFVAICTVGIIIVGYFFNAIQFLLV